MAIRAPDGAKKCQRKYEICFLNLNIVIEKENKCKGDGIQIYQKGLLKFIFLMFGNSPS